MSGQNLDFDLLVHQAWPAPYQETLGGWTFRYAEGVTKRANSVLPLGDPADLDKAVRAAEEFYAERGLPCVFFLGPGAAPRTLDGLLDQRGYRIVDPTSFMVLSLDGEIAPPVHEVKIADRPTAEWLTTWWSVDGRFGSEGLAPAQRILDGVPASYAAVEENGKPVAVGRSVQQGDTLGVYCMATLPEARRRGLGRSVLRALLAHGRARGAAHAYLVVVASNGAAVALYAGEGFTLMGGYHYRVR